MVVFLSSPSRTSITAFLDILPLTWAAGLGITSIILTLCIYFFFFSHCLLEPSSEAVVNFDWILKSCVRMQEPIMSLTYFTAASMLTKTETTRHGHMGNAEQFNKLGKNTSKTLSQTLAIGCSVGSRIGMLGLWHNAPGASGDQPGSNGTTELSGDSSFCSLWHISLRVSTQEDRLEVPLISKAACVGRRNLAIRWPGITAGLDWVGLHTSR